MSCEHVSLELRPKTSEAFIECVQMREDHHVSNVLGLGDSWPVSTGLWTADNQRRLSRVDAVHTQCYITLLCLLSQVFLACLFCSFHISKQKWLYQSAIVSTYASWSQCNGKRSTESQTDRQTDRHTHIHTDTHRNPVFARERCVVKKLLNRIDR